MSSYIQWDSGAWNLQVGWQDYITLQETAKEFTCVATDIQKAISIESRGWLHTHDDILRWFNHRLITVISTNESFKHIIDHVPHISYLHMPSLSAFYISIKTTGKTLSFKKFMWQNSSAVKFVQRITPWRSSSKSYLTLLYYLVSNCP